MGMRKNKPEKRNDNQPLSNGSVKDKVVGNFSRQFVIDRVEVDEFLLHSFTKRNHHFSDINSDVSDIYASDARRQINQRHCWDPFMGDLPTNRSIGSDSVLSDPSKNQPVRRESECHAWVNISTGNDLMHQRQRREHRTRDDRDHLFRDDCRPNLECHVFRRKSESSREHNKHGGNNFIPDDISPLRGTIRMCSEGSRPPELRGSSMRSPPHLRVRTQPTLLPVFPHERALLDPDLGQPSVTSQGQVVDFQRRPFGQGSDRNSDGDSRKESRQRRRNPQLIRKESGFGFTVTFENEEEVFDKGEFYVNGTLPVAETTTSGCSAKDSGIHLSETEERSTPSTLALPYLDKATEAMRPMTPKDERGAAEESLSGRRKDPDRGKINRRLTEIDVTRSRPNDFNQRTIGQIKSSDKHDKQGRPLMSTPLNGPDRIRRKDKAPQANEQPLRKKLDLAVQHPDLLRIEFSVSAKQGPDSPKTPRETNSNMNDLFCFLPPPPEFGDEISCFSGVPGTRLEGKVEGKKPPPPPPKRKPCSALRQQQKKPAALPPELLWEQPRWLPSQTPLLVPNEEPQNVPSCLHIGSAGKECSEKNKVDRGMNSESTEASGTSKALNRDYKATKIKKEQSEDGIENYCTVTAEKFRKDYVNGKVPAPKLETSAVEGASDVQEKGSNVEKGKAAAPKRESEEKAAVEKVRNKAEATLKRNSPSTSSMATPMRTQRIPPGPGTEPSMTSDMPNVHLLEATPTKQEARIISKDDPIDNQIKNAGFQALFHLSAPPGFEDSSEGPIDRINLSSIFSPSQLPNSPRVISESVPLINSGRYLTHLISAWTPEDVGEWLENLGLTDHRYSFVRHTIDGPKLLALDRNSLVSLGMINHLHRMKLERARMTQVKENQQSDAATSD